MATLALISQARNQTAPRARATDVTLSCISHLALALAIFFPFSLFTLALSFFRATPYALTVPMMTSSNGAR